MTPSVPDSQHDPVVTCSRHLLPGTIISGRIRIDALLGEGATAAVYRGHHSTLNKVVAVKVIHKRLLDSAASIERFMREARAVSMLEHQGLARLYCYGEEEPIGHYMVLEFIDGGSLTTKLQRDGQMTPQEAVEIVLQTCGSLMVVHDAGLVHGDVKPDNIMVTQSPDGKLVVKVVDFGMASFNSDAIDQMKTLTGTGVLPGSSLYMSPERWEGHPVDSRADVYAVGCVLYELVTGRPPFEGDSADAVISAHLHEPVDNLKFPDTVSLPLRKIILDSLQKDPAVRCQSVHALSTSLKQLDFQAVEPPIKVGSGLKIALTVLAVMAIGYVVFVASKPAVVQDTAAKIASLPPVPQPTKVSPRDLVATYSQWLLRKEQGSLSQGLAHAYLSASLNDLDRSEDAAWHAQKAFALLREGRTDTILNGIDHTENAARLVEALGLVYGYIDRALANEDLTRMIEKFEVADALDRKLVLARMYHSLAGLVDLEIDESGRSEALAQELKLLREGKASLNEVILTEVALAEALWAEGKRQEAGALLTQAMDSAKELKHPFPGVFSSIAMALLTQQRFDEAQQMAQTSQDAFLDANIKDGVAGVVSVRARALVALNHESLAFDLCEKCFDEFFQGSRLRERWQLVAAMAESDARGHLGKFDIVRTAQQRLIEAGCKTYAHQEAQLSYSCSAASCYVTEHDVPKALRLTVPLKPVLMGCSSLLINDLAVNVISLTELWRTADRLDLSIDLLQDLVAKNAGSKPEIGFIAMRVHLAQYLVEENRYAEANDVASYLRKLDSALSKKSPELLMEAYGTAGAVAEKNRDFKEALECYRKAYSIIEPGVRTRISKQTVVRLGLARMCMRFGELKETEVLLHQCDSAAKNYGAEVREMLLHQFAEYCLARKDLIRAGQYFEAYGAYAKEQNKDYIMIMNQYPALLEKMGKKSEAQKWRRKLNALSKSNNNTTTH